MATKIPKPMSKAEAELLLQLRATLIDPGVAEYRFSAPRRWRFDRAWPELRFAVEIEGVTGGQGGRHQRIEGFNQDVEKYEAAMLQGWTVYRVTQQTVKSGRAVEVIGIMLQRLQVSLDSNDAA